MNGLDFSIEYNTKINLIEDTYKKTKESIESNQFKDYFKLN